jgi:uncharacterized protein YfiM (DUF2279 family)
MKLTLTLLLALSPALSFADAWTGKDKTQHAAVGAVIGAAITAATDDPLKGCMAATAVGLAKEVYDHQHPTKHTSSFKDFAVTAAFGCASAYATGWVITPKEIRYSFNF